MKKFFCLLLVILMISSLTVCAFANEVITVVPIAPGYGYSHYKYHNYGHNFSERKFIPVVKEIKCIDTTPKKVIPIVPEQKNEVQIINCELIPVVPKQKEHVKIGEYNLIPIVPEQKKQVQINENIFIPVVSYTKPIEPSNTVKIIPVIPVTGVPGEIQ